MTIVRDEPSVAETPLRLLPNEDAAYNENNLARAAIWWLSPVIQMPVWEALEMTGFTARVSGIPEELGPLAQSDTLPFIVLQTCWAEQSPESRCRNYVPYSLSDIHRRLGHAHPPNGLEIERLRRSLLRLTYAKIEREWYDASRGESVRQVRSIIADADFIAKGRPGQFGRAMRGFVRFAPELFDQLNRRQVAYALDLPTMLALTPLGQRLYQFLAADQMKPVDGRRDLVAYTYPLGRAFYDTLGISDTNVGRLRVKIQQAGDAIRELEPLYLKIAIEERSRRRHEWQLTVVRRKGRSQAPAARRRLAEEAARASRAATNGPLPYPSEPLSATREDTEPRPDPEEVRRRTAAREDPRVKAAFERWMSESSTSPAHEIALREYRRDLMDWIVAGEQGPEPPEPVLS